MPRRYVSGLHAKCMIDARPAPPGAVSWRRLKIDVAKKCEENSNHA
ncbi:hypothetical protein X751_25355 [Mesorhizobium sp. LNJC395A00]|nr:hypothetical protein X751_25355 [Mesorhizobium sp. LNJC395A00]